MASAKQVNEAFLTKKSKNNEEVEKAVYRNITRIEDTDINEIHTNLMKVLDIKSNEDSKYNNIERFKKLVERSREKKREAIAKKQQQNKQ